MEKFVTISARENA